MHKLWVLAIAGGLAFSWPITAVSAAFVSLIDARQIHAVVVLPEAPQADETLAATELQTYLKRISGQKLSIVRGRAAPGLLPIRVGLSLAPGAKEILDRRSRDPSSFLIGVDSAGVTIAGLSPQGTLFGACEVLERLGCRWYFPGELGTIVPRRETVALAEGTSLHVPSFGVRHLQGVSPLLAWYRQQKLGGPSLPSCHGIQLAPAADIRKEPDLFALVDGKRTGPQFCVSNPEVLRRAIAWALDYFRKHPEEPWVGMGPADGSGFCQCPNCRKLDSGRWDPFSSEPVTSDRYIWFLNQVLDAVQAKFPGKKIAYYAYHTYQYVPTKVVPRPDLVPILAPISLCRIHGMSNPICPDRSVYRTFMADLGKAFSAVYERGYYFNLADPGLPFSKIHAVRDETPAAYKLGIKGWRVEVQPSWATYGPTLYVAARLMWDVNTDVDAVLSEFYQKFFGPAAEPMGKYLASMDRTCRDTDCHVGGSFCLPQLYPPSWMAQAKAWLEEAAAKAPTGVYAERVRIFRMNYDRLEAFLGMLAARNRFDFKSAMNQLNRLRDLTTTMVNDGLCSFESIKRPEQKPTQGRSGAYLLDGIVTRYLDRFYSICTESGYERTQTKGQFVAGASDEWDFLIDPSRVGEELGWYRDGRIGGNWQKIKAYSAAWGDQGLYYYKGIAWYRTAVTIPRTFKGRNIFLWFGGVDEKAKVWLNGRLLGENADLGKELPGQGSTFSPFEASVTDAVRFDRPNVIAVKITNQMVNELGTGGITAPVMFWAQRDK